MPYTADRSRGAVKIMSLTLEANLELAFSNLRLAEAETSGGKAAHATELITKAILAHRSVLQELACIPDSYEGKRDLTAEATRLLEAIQFVERQFRAL